MYAFRSESEVEADEHFGSRRRCWLVGKVGRGEVSFFTILCRLHLDDARPDDMSIISSLWIARSRVVSQDLEDTVCSAMGYTSRVSSHS